MGKLLSAVKNQISSLITLIVLFILGALYFFVYIPNNEKTVQERRFRCLQNIDYNIRDKIRGTIQMMGNILITSKGSVPIIDTTIKTYQSKSKEFGFELLSRQDAKSKIDTSKPLGLDEMSYMTRIEADPKSQQLYLFVTENHPKNAHDTISLGTRFGYDKFITPLLPSGIFDGYIVFIKNIKVYESFPTGFNFNDKDRDSLFEVKSKLVTPGSRSVRIGGIDYKIFSQSIYSFTGDEWIICGLVSNENYQNEKNQLPVPVVVFLLTAAILMLVSLPWIKLYHMGNKDRLSIRDGIATLLVSMIMVSLMFFLFFKYNSVMFEQHLPMPADEKHPPRQRDVPIYSDSYPINRLAEKIDLAFGTELDKAYALLNTIDKSQYFSNGQTIHIKKNTRLDTLFNLKPDRVHASQIAWLDSKGKIASLLTNNDPKDADAPIGTDLQDRQYYKNANKGSFNHPGGDQYYIDQVISRSSNLFESIIAKKSVSADRGTKASIAVMVFRARSLDSVIMPDGYQFAVIDNTGKVLYHYLSERNLSENLKKEFTDSSKLVSSIEAKSDTSFEEEYYGKHCRIKIKPIKDLPYFVVLFEDMEYSDSLDTESSIFTMAMLVSLLTFMAIQFLVVFFASEKRSFLKKHTFDASIFAPKSNSHRSYNLATIYNFFIIVLLVIGFGVCDSFLEYMCVILFSITSIPIFLNVTLARSYKKSDPYLYQIKKRVITWLFVFVAAIIIAAIFLLEGVHLINLLVFEIILTLISIGLYLKGDALLDRMRLAKIELSEDRRFKQFHFKWAYTNSYTLMTVTRLIITSGIPVVFFFVYSFNYELKLDTRYRQLKFAKELNGKIQFNDSVTKQSDTATIIKTHQNKLDSMTTHSLYTSSIYCDGLYIDSLSYKKKREGSHKIHFKKEDAIMTWLLEMCRYNINSVELKNNYLILPDIDDSTHFNTMHSALNPLNSPDQYHAVHTSVPVDAYERLKISSGLIGYVWPFWSYWVLFLAIGLFYLMLHKVIKKLFARDLPSDKGWKEIDEILLGNNELNSLLMIVGAPGSGKLKRVKKLLKPYPLSNTERTELKGIEGNIRELKKYFTEHHKLCGNDGELLVYDEHNQSKSNVFIADMINIPDDPTEDNSEWEELKVKALNDHNCMVIINHFEYNISKQGVNSAKLDLLEKLMLKGKAKILIISTVHPVSFLDSFNNSDDGSETNAISQSELERWHVLLGHYRIIIEPLIESKVKEENSIVTLLNRPEVSEDDIMLGRMIVCETAYTHFMNNMQEMMLSHMPLPSDEVDLDQSRDSMIFKLQLTSQYFYTYIWQSLTKEEKLLLYDLAEDGLVNPYDDHNLSMLIAKGIIIKVHGTLELFNKGFRNFILTAIGITEAKRIKDQIKDNGNWGNLRMPLNLVILAILFFLILSKQESYSRIITYITTVGAGFTAILRIFPSLGSGSRQKTE